MSTPVDPIERKLEREVVETSIASCKTMAGSPEALAWHSAVKDLIAHRTAHTPKPPDCRPPAEHEGERWHWLEHTSSFEPWAWCGHGDTGWYRGDLDAPLISPMDMAKAGWFYRSVASPVAPPSPPGEQVYPTDEAIKKFVRDKWRGPNYPEMIADISAALTHFRSPARTVSDEEIRRAYYANLFPGGIIDHHAFARELMDGRGG